MEKTAYLVLLCFSRTLVPWPSGFHDHLEEEGSRVPLDQVQQ